MFLAESEQIYEQLNSNVSILGGGPFDIEAEVLFMPGTRFEITNVEVIDGIRYVEMKEIT